MNNDFFWPIMIAAWGGVLAALKAAFSNEIEYWVVAIAAMQSRPFDSDRNLKTRDQCQIFNEGNGQWETVIIVGYRLGFNKNVNGVYVQRYSTTNNGQSIWIEERIPFRKWGNLRKAKIKSPINS